MLCKKCGSRNLVCNIIQDKIEAGNDFYINKDFGKIEIMVQVCWCSDCGEKDSSDILSINKIGGSPLER